MNTIKNCSVKDDSVFPIVKVITKEENFQFVMKEEGSLLSGLQQAGREILAPCGGSGRCGKCKVQVVEGELSITTQDRAVFSKEELDSGWRLACGAIPTDDLTIRLGWKSEQNMEVQSEFTGNMDFARIAITDNATDNIRSNMQDGKSQSHFKDCYGIAIDIGTTTIAAQLVNLSSGQILGTQTALNNQRAYGADVISRILAATRGKDRAMTASIRQDLSNLMEQLCMDNFVKMEQITKVVIAGNTTMIHLLMEYPCDGLGRVPFTPYEIGTIHVLSQDLFSDDRLKAEVWICPGISAFVGADITSGMCALMMGKSEEICLLVDLGTNGEMALGNKDKLLVTSTAAGPAFEGGNITYGIGSIPGAICNAELENDKLVIKTIQDEKPTGICGTGVIEIVAALVKRRVIDETGLLDDMWFEDGYPVAIGCNGEHIVLTQEDIREIQLAKAAVRGGIETLLYRYGITAEQVDRVYIAGGFGYALDYEKAAQIGMFPTEFSGKVQAVGNSSLGGAVKILLDADAINEAEKIADLAEKVDLASDAIFQNAYIDAMSFEIG